MRDISVKVFVLYFHPLVNHSCSRTKQLLTLIQVDKIFNKEKNKGNKGLFMFVFMDTLNKKLWCLSKKFWKKKLFFATLVHPSKSKMYLYENYNLIY